MNPKPALMCEPLQYARYSVGQRCVIGGGIEYASKQNKNTQHQKSQRQGSTEASSKLLQRTFETKGFRNLLGLECPEDKKDDSEGDEIASPVKLAKAGQDPARCRGRSRNPEPGLNE